MEQSVTLSQLAGLKKISSEFSNLGSEYVYSRLTDSKSFRRFAYGPIRLDGMTWILCLKGTMKLDINLMPHTLTANTMLVAGPDNILELKELEGDEIDIYTIFISPDFLRSTNIDINIISSIPANPRTTPPILEMTDEETDLLRRYFDIIHHNTTTNPDDKYVRSISRCLIAAVCYQVIQLGSKRLADQALERPGTRRATYVFEFKNLVGKYYKRERSVAFYADKMFISPKYLSLIIKETTGRSASQWIDEYVILEAKNLLRFSGKNVQQVAYELNFTNQSSFGKYFKHLTGMSPTEYQRS